MNFTNNDPYGTSGGDIRIHGQDGNHISLTLDGMPLNDTGNYAVYTNQMIDPEVIDRVSVNDLHATILHTLGLNHEKLTYRYSGRDFRLTDVSGRVVNEILK